MHVVYGIAVPPGLDGDTRGEVRVRVERLMLRKERLAEGRDGWELEACAVHPVWWGDKQTDRKSSARCTPSTPETARGVTTFVFPVKTLRPQLEAYFAHMNAADEGLNLNVVVPASASGKRRDVPLGAASLRLEALTPKAAIAGWFTVVSASGAEAIGRVKLHVSVQYFDAPKRSSPAKPAAGSANAAAANEVTIEAADVPATSHPADGAAEATARSSSATPAPPATQGEGHRVGQHAAVAGHAPAPQSTLPTAEAAPPLTAAPPVSVAPPSGVMVEQIEHVFRRGLEIRAAMMRAASPGTAPAVENGASTQRAATRFASVFDGARFGLSANDVEPSLVDAIAFHRHDADDFGGETDDSDSDDSLSVSASGDSDDGPHRRHGGATTHGHHHQPHQHAQQQLQALRRPQQHPHVTPSQGQMIRDPCLFRIRLVSVSLAARGFDACQFSLRVSRDVLFTQPPPDPMWSACFELPLEADSGAFTLPVTAYSPGSKAVIEVFGISHQRRAVALLGIAMVPLSQAHHTAVDFRCPTTSTVEAQAEVIVDRAAIEAAATRQPQRPTQDETAIKSGPVIQMPSSRAAESLACPPRSAHEPPKHYRVVDALVGSPQDREELVTASAVPHTSTEPQPAASQSRDVPPLPAHGQFQQQNAALVPPVASEGHCLTLKVSNVKAMPKMVLPGAERSQPPRVVIAIDGLRDVNGHVVDDWNCETDAFVAHASLRDDGSGNVELETTVRVGEHTPVGSIASLALRVFALTPGSAEDVFTGNVVTTAELMAHCVDVGEVNVDLRAHLRYRGPPADGWYHVRTAGGTAGQLRVSCASH